MRPGANPTLSAAALATLGLGDGPTTKAVRLTVSDGENVVTSDTTITVNNVAPTAGRERDERLVVDAGRPVADRDRCLARRPCRGLQVPDRLG